MADIIKDQQEHKIYLGGAQRNSDIDKIDPEAALSPLVILRYAEYMKEHRLRNGEPFRNDDNWQNGIPKARYIKSLFRHFLELWKLWRGTIKSFEMEEEACCAIMFNVMGFLYETIKQRTILESQKLQPASPIHDLQK